MRIKSITEDQIESRMKVLKEMKPNPVAPKTSKRLINRTIKNLERRLTVVKENRL